MVSNSPSLFDTSPCPFCGAPYGERTEGNTTYLGWTCGTYQTSRNGYVGGIECRDMKDNPPKTG